MQWNCEGLQIEMAMRARINVLHVAIECGSRLPQDQLPVSGVFATGNGEQAFERICGTRFVVRESYIERPQAGDFLKVGTVAVSSVAPSLQSGDFIQWLSRQAAA